CTRGSLNFFFFSSRRRHTRFSRDWSSDVCSSDLSTGRAFPNFPPKAKRVIYLFQSGGPSQIDLYDYKPFLNKVHQQEVPDSVFKIGRASCRERGETAAVAVSSKRTRQRRKETAGH